MPDWYLFFSRWYMLISLHIVQYFATGSRDKCVVVWGPSPSPSWQVVGFPLILPEAVTALAMPQVVSF